MAPRPALLEDERNSIEIFKKAAPGVVSVANKALVRDFWSLQVFEIPSGAGSGFVWDKEGHIISNFHVVEGASAIQITMKDGTKYDAKVVGLDPDHDLAVLKIDAPAEKLCAIEPGNSKDLQVGQKVLAIGNPFGFECSLSVGVVSSIGRSMKTLTGITLNDVIQTDAAINSGNSGGPLLDSAGRLIGINTAIVTPTGGSVGIGFAIPVDTAKEFIPQLIKHGHIMRAGLGFEPFNDRLAEYYGIDGVIVKSVYEGGPAHVAGIRGTRKDRIGDIITHIDGEPVSTVGQLRTALINRKPDDKVEITFIRDGKSRTAKATLQSLE